MKKITAILALLLFTSMQVLYAQRTITGSVVDEKGEPLIGVNIITKEDAGKGTVTDFDGKFSLALPEGTTALIFKFLGFEQQEVTLGSSDFYNITMAVSSEEMDEVIIIGYGTEKKRDVSGAISSVSAEDLQKQPVQSIDKALQGRAAGVQVTTNSGLPGSAVSVRIRGTGSINASNEPLYIIDGVQVESGDQSRILTSSNALSALNPEDIESIEILKDGASASIYGAQAANGVVIITTKRGKEGKTNFSFSATSGFVSQSKRIDVLSGPEFVELTLESYYNRSAIQVGTQLNRYNVRGYDITDPNGNGIPSEFDYSNVPSYDWQDAVFRTGALHDYQVSASGGDEKTSFYVAGSFNSQEGQVMASDFQRLTFRTNLNHKVNDRLSFDLSTNVSNTQQNSLSDGASFRNPYNSSLGIVPTNSIYNEDGSFNDQLVGVFTHNVIAENTYDKQFGEINQLLLNMAINVSIVDGLRYRGTFGLDFYDIIEDQRWDPRIGDGRNYNGSVQAYNTRNINRQTDHTLTYAKTFADRHEVEALAGFSWRHSKRNTISALGTGLPSYKFTMLYSTNTDLQNASATMTEWKLAGVFGRLKYTLDRKYIFKATVRRDGSSRFGEGNKWGVFPSGSAAWRISEEEFMSGIKDKTGLDNFKLRLSYGITGNSEIGNYSSLGLYLGGGSYVGGTGMYPAQMANPDLGWEESETWDIGVDIAFAQGRYRTTIDYFVRNTSELLLSRPVPSTTGFENVWENVGEMKNSGIEIEVGATIFAKKNFKWDIDLNFTYSTNEVISLLDTIEFIYQGSYNYARVGDPYPTSRWRRWAGVNPADGRPMWLDRSGNITYNPLSDDRMWTGQTSNPPYYGGITSTFTIFKDFEVSLFFQLSAGNYQYNTNMQIFGNSGNDGSFNSYQSQYDDRWRVPGDMTWVAKPMRSNGYQYGGLDPAYPSTRDVEKMDYIRLKNIVVTYNVPSTISKKLKLSSMQAFFQATNLWTNTNYRGWDPEFTGYDWGVYPQAQTVTFGIKASL